MWQVELVQRASLSAWAIWAIGPVSVPYGPITHIPTTLRVKTKQTRVGNFVGIDKN